MQHVLVSTQVDSSELSIIQGITQLSMFKKTSSKKALVY